MIKAVLFDFFGVLYPDTFWGLANKFLGTRSEETQQELHNLIKQSDLGVIDKKVFWQEAAQLFGVPLHTLEKELGEFGGVDRELLSRITLLKEAGIKVGIISNIGQGMAESSLGSDIKLFDVLVLSGDTGFVKPDHQVYEIAIKKLNLKPAECLFFDDIPRNVRGAEAIGMHAVHYRGLLDYDRAVKELMPNMDN
jgi:epoxide hydrolase-like predicted phosphatase